VQTGRAYLPAYANANANANASATKIYQPLRSTGCRQPRGARRDASRYEHLPHIQALAADVREYLLTPLFLFFAVLCRSVWLSAATHPRHSLLAHKHTRTHAHAHATTTTLGQEAAKGRHQDLPTLRNPATQPLKQAHPETERKLPEVFCGSKREQEILGIHCLDGLEFFRYFIFS
jgi:hypothetical protein